MPKKTSFARRTDDSQLGKLFERYGTTDEEELQRGVWFQVFQLGSQDDLDMWAVEHYDLYALFHHVERLRWPRRDKSTWPDGDALTEENHAKYHAAGTPHRHHEDHE